MAASRLKALLASALVGLTAAATTPLRADDTDIYVAAPGNFGATSRPNVLLILDTSASMGGEVPFTGGRSRIQEMRDALTAIVSDAHNVNMGLMRFTDPGGAVVYPMADLDALASAIEGSSSGSIDSSQHTVSTRSDDVQEAAGDNAIDLDGQFLTLGKVSREAASLAEQTLTLSTAGPNDVGEQRVGDGVMLPFSSTNRFLDLAVGTSALPQQINGLRFPNATIPRGARVVSAYLQLVPGTTNSTPLTMQFQSQATDSAAEFTTAAGNVSNRSRSQSRVNEEVGNWAQGQRVALTSNLAALVQEVVCRGETAATAGCPAPPTGGYTGNWASGGALGIITNYAAGSGRRTAEWHDTRGINSPRLVVTYKARSTAVPASNTVALRFVDVGVPRGARVTDARIEFIAARDSSDPNAAFTIRAEAAGDSAPFSASSRIGTRTYGATTVDWNSGSADSPLTQWTKENIYATPNLAGILQEVVNRADWCGNNAVSFSLEPTAAVTTVDSRVAYSRDYLPPPGDSAVNSRTPVLRVSYDLSSVPADTCLNQIVSSQIAENTDDASETSSGSMLVTGAAATPISLSDGLINGFRFRDVRVPKGARVLDARVIFTANAADTGAATITWRGHLATSPPGFTTTKKDISNRPLTASTVTDANVSAWNAAGERQPSANLAPIVQEIINQAEWLPGNALVLTQTASGQRRAESYDGNAAQGAILRIKAVFPDGGDAVDSVTVRNRLVNQIIPDLAITGQTPIVGALHEAARYYRGEEVVHGRKRGHRIGTEDNRPRTRISHPASYRDGVLASITETGVVGPRNLACTGNNPADAACWTEYIADAAPGKRPTYIAPPKGACQADYIVLLTDGEANHNSNEEGVDHGVSRVQELVGGTCQNAAPGELCGRELAKFLRNDPNSPDFRPDDRSIKLYTIAFNLNPNAPGIPFAEAEQRRRANVFVQDLAKLGGSENSFKADTAQQLVEVFRDFILVDVLSSPASFASPATTVNAFNRLESGLDIYYALFAPSKQVGWKGNLKKYSICSPKVFGDACTPGDIVGRGGVSIANPDGTLNPDAQDFFDGGRTPPPTEDPVEQVVTTGGAAGRVPAYAQRKVYTYTGSYPLTGAPPNLAGADHLVSVENTRLTKGLLLGDPAMNRQAEDAAMTDAERSDLIDWMRGRDVDDTNGDGNTTENRYHFGDPMHATAAVVTYGGTEAAPVQGLFLPTNDGGLRMLDASTGDELWVWYPQEMLGLQRVLRSNVLGQHRYGLDLPPTLRIKDVKGDGIITAADGDFVHLFVGMRDGGENYYALDVTPANAGSLLVQPKLLWAIRGGPAGDSDFVNLRRSWSQPTVTTIRVGAGGGGPNAGNSVARTVLVFGGGHTDALDYDFGTGSDNLQTKAFGQATGGNILYVVDAETGKLVTSIGGEKTNAKLTTRGYDPGRGMDYPIPSNISAFDSDGDGSADRMYFGDLGGQVWRVDLNPTLTERSTNGAVGVVSKLAEVSVPKGAEPGPHAENTRKFYNAPSIVRVRDNQFSTIGRYDLILLGSGTRQDPLNMVTKDRFYGFRDFDTGPLADQNADGLADREQAGATDPTQPLVPPRYPLEERDLFDVTGNPFQTNADGSRQDPTGFDAALPDFRESAGWLIDLRDFPGEKVLSKATVAGGVLLFTTYVPEASEEMRSQCQLAAGFSRLYGLNVLTGAARFANWSSTGAGPDGGSPATADRAKVIEGGGLASSPVTVAVDLGVTQPGLPPSESGGEEVAGGGSETLSVLGCYGSGAALRCENLGVGTPRLRTYWMQR